MRCVNLQGTACIIDCLFFLQKYHNFACKFNVFLYIANLLLIISV